MVSLVMQANGLLSAANANKYNEHRDDELTRAHLLCGALNGKRCVCFVLCTANCASSHVKRVYKEPVPWWSRLFSFNSKQYERHEIVKKLIEQVMDDGANGRHPPGLGSFNAETSCQSSDTDSGESNS
jgi:hypothetical protein